MSTETSENQPAPEEDVHAVESQGASDSSEVIQEPKPIQEPEDVSSIEKSEEVQAIVEKTADNHVESVPTTEAPIVEEQAVDNGPLETTEPAKIQEPIAAVPKKKRLTLQERLALAAAKGGKKTQKKARDVSTDSTPRTSIDLQDRPSSVALENLTDSAASPKAQDTAASEADDIEWLPENLESLDHDALKTVIKDAAAKYNELKRSFKEQQSINADLRSELARKESKQVPEQNQSVLAKKLKEKEEIIKELMDEGSKLSMKELQLSTTIKKLKSKAIEDADLIGDLQEKLDKTLNKVANFEAKEIELKDFETKRERFNSDMRELESKYKNLQDEHSKVTAQFKEMKAQRLEQQLETTRQKLDDETKKNRELGVEVNELNIRIKLLKDQSKTETFELEEKLNKERARYQILQEENANEIKRLEDKMESWRAVNESSTRFNDGDSNNESLKKLAASNELIQTQYTAAQENWKFIESSYLNKLAQAEQDINTLKQKDLASNKRIKVLSGELKAKNEELEEALDNETRLAAEIADLKEQISIDGQKITSLQKDVDSLAAEFEKARTAHERELEEELTKQRTKLEKEFSEKQANKSFDGPIQQQQALYMNDLFANPAFLKSRSFSNLGSNDNIAFGESSTTPRSTHANSRRTSSSVLNQQYFASASVRTPMNEVHTKFFESPRAMDSPQMYDDSFNLTQEDDYSYDEEFGEDYNNTSNNNVNNNGTRSPATSEHSSKHTLQKYPVNGSGNNAASTIGSLGGGPSNKNIQIIGKLSSQIRRLEVESLALKDEVALLSKQKNEANNEIVRLLNENSEVSELKSTKDATEARLAELEKKYQRTLEILGEKSERVEELTADVQDLKDLCKQQVQQLVGLQSN